MSDQLSAITTTLAFLLALPIVMMGVVMPTVVLTRGGEMMGGVGAWGLLLLLVPLTLFSLLAYYLYTYTGRASTSRSESSLSVLRSAYARGELSDEEFEARRNRLRGETGGVTDDE